MVPACTVNSTSVGVSVIFVIATVGMPVGQEDHTCFLVKNMLIFFDLDY